MISNAYRITQQAQTTQPSQSALSASVCGRRIADMGIVTLTCAHSLKGISVHAAYARMCTCAPYTHMVTFPGGAERLAKSEATASAQILQATLPESFRTITSRISLLRLGTAHLHRRIVSMKSDLTQIHCFGQCAMLADLASQLCVQQSIVRLSCSFHL